MANEIKTVEDIKKFLDETNSLHDGYITSVQYSNDGITSERFDTTRARLVIKILVTSICDTIVELEFENILKWQVRDDYSDILDTTLLFDKNNSIIWATDVDINIDELTDSSYVIAKTMKWRFV